MYRFKTEIALLILFNGHGRSTWVNLGNLGKPGARGSCVHKYSALFHVIGNMRRQLTPPLHKIVRYVAACRCYLNPCLSFPVNLCLWLSCVTRATVRAESLLQFALIVFGNVDGTTLSIRVGFVPFVPRSSGRVANTQCHVDAGCRPAGCKQLLSASKCDSFQQKG